MQLNQSKVLNSPTLNFINYNYSLETPQSLNFSGFFLESALMEAN